MLIGSGPRVSNDQRGGVIFGVCTVPRSSALRGLLARELPLDAAAGWRFSAARSSFRSLPARPAIRAATGRANQSRLPLSRDGGRGTGGDGRSMPRKAGAWGNSTGARGDGGEGGRVFGGFSDFSKYGM